MSSSKKFIRNESAEFTSLDSLLQEASGTPVRSKGSYAPVADPVSEMLEAKKETAYQEGYAAGYEWGVREGYDAGKRQEEERILNFALELKALIGRIEASMDLWFQKAEYGLAALSYEIAKKVISNELEQRPDVIVHIVREALGRVTNSNKATVKLNPFDAAVLDQHRDQLIAVAGFVKGVEIVGDESLQRGSVIIESDNGIIDASIETKLSRIQESEAA
ncbi:MAG: FliH/SctL family protein [Fimbriimonadales bacterium]